MDLNILGKDMYEISSTKQVINYDLPIHIGVAVYQLAKLKMLQFKYDFIDVYFKREDYQYMYMDTDSAYI
jgi:hypothetical protein